MSEDQRRQNVWGVVVSSLCRSEGNVRSRFPICELHGVQPEGIAHCYSGVYTGRSQEFSHLAIRGWIAHRRCTAAIRAEREDGMQLAMTQRTSAHPLAKDSSRRGQPGLMFAVALIAVAGAMVSSVSLYHHYRTSKTAFC